MTTSLNDIRSHFLEYFKKLDHEVVPSAPLIPHNDPTLMFVNSGMVPFKNLFLGQEKRDYKRAVTAQKCVRAGGKHNDLDNVGYTARHHTFFEMLGNFSFGDYFKDRAIAYAWDLITKEFKIPKDKLYVTVYHTDEEAIKIWKSYAGLPDERIIRIKTNDNFWMMGATGPCGPCSEIFYDHGEHIAGGPPGSPDEDGDRFIEIWNIVFMQNEQFDDGKMQPLKMQSIDTGMGLERIAALLQGSHDNYDTDLMRDLIETSAGLTNADPYGKMNVSHRVLADHLRSSAFLIADGVMPQNEGRGYVLRRIMRRAMRHAYLLGAKDPVMHKMVPALVKQMGQAYPELQRGQVQIEKALELEEKNFITKLERGMKLLDKEILTLGAGKTLSGQTAFNLYDTYGFPLDLTQDVLREKGLRVDDKGFDTAMREQKTRARASWSGSSEIGEEAIWFDIAREHGETNFWGYEKEMIGDKIIALVKDGKMCSSAQKGDKVDIIVNQTPFYPESGGQVGDTGQIDTDGGWAEVTNTVKKAGVIIHRAKVREGRIWVDDNDTSLDVDSQSLYVGDASSDADSPSWYVDSAALTVDGARRTAIRANHSATHLLHEALRQCLGDHVAQHGSLNDENRLRFDFSHDSDIKVEEKNKIEDEVNRYIRQNTKVNTETMNVDEARALGAQALFGEKYGKEVRVVAMGRQDDSGKGVDKKTYSLELCGGTHVARTGDIGLFILVNETSVSSGVRRIEGLTGQAAINYFREQKNILTNTASLLKSPINDLPRAAFSKMDEIKDLHQAVLHYQSKAIMNEVDHAPAEHINDIELVTQFIKDVSGKDLRGLIDKQKATRIFSVIVFISDIDGKAAIAVGVTDKLKERISAVDIVKIASEALDGNGGGGRPDFAQAGGGDASKHKKAFSAIRDYLIPQSNLKNQPPQT